MRMQDTSPRRPTKAERDAARNSLPTLIQSLESITTDVAEIEIEETAKKIRVPRKALQLLATILKAISEGKPTTIVPLATEMTTQAAAELLGCSRPHVVKLLEEGRIPFTLVGRHRRIKYDDLMAYRDAMKAQQREKIIGIMRSDERSGLYDS